MLPTIGPRVANHSMNALPLLRQSPSRTTLGRSRSENELRNGAVGLPRILSEPILSVKRHKGIWGDGPPKARAYKKHVDVRVFDKNRMFDIHQAPATSFRRHYERGDIPVAVKHSAAKPALEWKVDCKKLDYSHHMPIFIEGLLEKTSPYDSLAELGIIDMIRQGQDQLLPVLPRCIQPLKSCLNTKDPKTICKALLVLQEMIRADRRIGEKLVPYYRQLLPVFRLFVTRNLNLGDGIEYSQRKRENLGDLINETLGLLESTGGPDAFINIKYLIPTYESQK